MTTSARPFPLPFPFVSSGSLPLLFGFPLRFPVASSFFPSDSLRFRFVYLQFRILSFLFFLSALRRFRLPVAFPTPRHFLSSLPDLPRSAQLVSHSSLSVPLIQRSCLFPFALPCFAPTAVPQVLRYPPPSTASFPDSSMFPFAPLPPWISPVLPLRSRPFRTPLLGLRFFLSPLQASASQWLPLCPPRFPHPLRLVLRFGFPPSVLPSVPFFGSSVFLLRARSLSGFVRQGRSSGFGTRLSCSSFHRFTARLTAASPCRLPSLSGSGLPLSSFPCLRFRVTGHTDTP